MDIKGKNSARAASIPGSGKTAAEHKSKKKPVRNQAYLRKKNKEDVVKLLRVGNLSYSDIARELRLSNTAIGNIADELISDGLIFRDGDTRGRSGITLSINGDLGYIFAVDLSGKDVNVCAADFTGKELCSRKIADVISFQRSDLDDLFGIMRNMSESKELKGKKLYCISVATPGKLSPETGEFLLNPRFKGFGNVSIKSLFEQEFGCKTVIKNDINLAMEGEKVYGTLLKNVNNALMLHIDVGTGAALMFDGKVYEGSHGFAGEIGFFKLDMFSSSPYAFENISYANYYDSLSLYSALSIVRRETQNGVEGYCKNYAEKNGVSPMDIPIRAMLEAYVSGDALVCGVLDAAARIIGTVAANLAEFLDVEMVILNGAVTELGTRFQNAVASLVDCPVRYSDLMKNATLMGAINAGIVEAIKDSI